ncbi:hypothetical protein F5884DRAFT_772917 [Xylogone sp. PMI_703]|nr:hypothetical protein F5884DRAFT_772917 [Xylogone sp. PMI_703]
MEPDEMQNHQDQAAILQNLARDGTQEANNAHSYAGGAVNGNNGAAPISDFTSAEHITYNEIGLGTNYDDLDPAALLESLANYEFNSSETQGHINVSNAHFASLLQAAANAGEGEAGQKDHENGVSTRSKAIASQYGFPPEPPNNRSKKRRQDQPNDEQFGFILPNKPKRPKVREPEDPEELALEREIWGPEEGEEANEPISPSGNVITTKIPGVHSASALFRKPSAASKKYTRPPMAKLFLSLGISPEQFLHLQAAGKAYMLDEAHPERREAVGSRVKGRGGQGQSDITKMELFNCVEAFLKDEGWGERLYGGGTSSKLRWPEMRTKIISLVTPLLRRMVTNERQRLYAIEQRRSGSPGTAQQATRKGVAATNPIPARATSTSVTEAADMASPHNSEHAAEQASSLSPTAQLDNYHYNIDSTFTAANGQNEEVQPAPVIGEDTDAKSEDITTTYHVNILQFGARIKPRLTLNNKNCPGFPSLVQYIHNIYGDEGIRPVKISILGPQGQLSISDDDSFNQAVRSVMENEWMDGEVKILVDVEKKE